MAGTPSLETISTKQMRIAELAKQMTDRPITSIGHHMNVAWLREAYERTRKDGAAGVDGQSAAEFAEDLEGNLERLLSGAKTGSYRAPPVRRVHIPKGDGTKTRPIGIPTFADKVMQRAVAMLLEPIYEEEFYDFSYGFRPGRSAHDALEALNEQLWTHMRKGGWVLDVDIQGFFDNLDHGMLRDLIRQRVTDGVVTRMIGKWLNAGVLADGAIVRPTAGTPQGGVISPLLANIYLHEVIDKWWVKEVLPRMREHAFMVRYADDFVMVFASREDADRVLRALVSRLARYGLTAHPEKTRLVDFRGPDQDGGGNHQGNFDFLGFTHYWGALRSGGWGPKRRTAKGRFTRALKTLNQWLRSARILPIAQQAKLLGRKLQGHFNYYGIRGNSAAISAFRYIARRLWWKWLGRRSQRARVTWSAFARLEQRHPLPPARLPPAAWVKG